MTQHAYVVNTGIITAIGDNTEQCLASLAAGRSGVGPIRFLDTHWRNEIPAAEVQYSNQQLVDIHGFNPVWPRTAMLSTIAIREALGSFDISGLRVGLLSANTVGGMDITETIYKDYSRSSDIKEFHRVVNHECGAVTELAARHLGIHGFITTISTACSSSANSIMMAAQMIRSGMLDVAIAGGADSMSRFTLNGFNTLMILDREPCRPFDNTRKGLNLGEGAGYLLLMSARAMKQCYATPLCTVSGFANTNDAYHQTASSPDGIGNAQAMQQAMHMAGITPADVDYINLHGTGTANNDSSEGKAIEKVFGTHVPKASSTKANTGHTLGAAGGVEAVFSVLSIRDGVIFPNLRWQQQMEDVSFRPATELETGRNIRHVLSNSFGFGGNCSSLVFSKC
jgi:3-oxoacyl-[acyl-carrier-protein] synthase-1